MLFRSTRMEHANSTRLHAQHAWNMPTVPVSTCNTHGTCQQYRTPRAFPLQVNLIASMLLHSSVSRPEWRAAELAWERDAADGQEGLRSGWHRGSEGTGAHTARKVTGPSLDLIPRVERSAEPPLLWLWAVWERRRRKPTVRSRRAGAWDAPRRQDGHTGRSLRRQHLPRREPALRLAPACGGRARPRLCRARGDRDEIGRAHV